MPAYSGPMTETARDVTDLDRFFGVAFFLAGVFFVAAFFSGLLGFGVEVGSVM